MANQPRVVFAVHDSTEYKNLHLIAERLPETISVEYLLLDDLFNEAGVPAEKLQPSRRATEYVRHDFHVWINQRRRPGPLHVAAFQRLLNDRISPHIAYRLTEYLDDAAPDLFVCGHDRLPFIKHVIKTCHDRGIPSVVVQHGIQNLQHVPADVEILDYLRPTNPLSSRIEYLKRWAFYNYGAYIFCNPYVDFVYTIGDFFTDKIENLRSEYPCSGNASVVTTGYPEYNLSEIRPYEPDITSGLFLSGWEYEAGEWSDDTQRQIAERLKQIEKTNGINIVVRPHPKDSEEKITRFYSDFKISMEDDITADIARHDLVLSVYSTALMLAVAEGKVCGVLRIPWEKNHFGPFQDPHMLEITADRLEVHDRARQLSTETQKNYLRRYCYIPAVHDRLNRGSPAEYIASRLTDLANKHPRVSKTPSHQ